MIDSNMIMNKTLEELKKLLVSGNIHVCVIGIRRIVLLKAKKTGLVFRGIERFN